MRKIIPLKIWPEIVEQYPAIISYERLEKTKNTVIAIDCANVSRVESAALTILLINILKTVNDLKDRNWDLYNPIDLNIDSLIRNLNFYKLLAENINSLFWQTERERDLNFTAIDSKKHNTLKRIYPIYVLRFANSSNKRAKVDEFKQYLIDELLYLQNDYDFELSVFIQILVEMAKNSADHTEDNAYFGLDIFQVGDTVKIQFSFGDLGIGINNNVRSFFQKSDDYKERAQHLGLTDSYQFALTIGNSCQNNTINKGIGMATIFGLSKQMNINLSVYDAKSRGFLSSATGVTYSELRKSFYSLGFNVGFYYYGDVEIMNEV